MTRKPMRWLPGADSGKRALTGHIAEATPGYPRKRPSLAFSFAMSAAILFALWALIGFCVGVIP